MCTAISDTALGHIFGRTLDLEYSLGEEVVITPRRFALNFLHRQKSTDHYAIIGAAHVEYGTPFYYDAVNERGLAAAALSFPKFCEYSREKSDTHNVASFELIPWVLSRAESAEEVRRLLYNATVTDESAGENLPATPLHWIFADKRSALTVECTSGGLKIHDNPEGVLTNSPNFECQLLNLERYEHIINARRSDTPSHSRGLYGFGIPGDFSSGSRFVRACYVKSKAARPKSKDAAISRLLHLFESISQPQGVTESENGKPVKTVYTSAIDTESLEYFFTTYENRRIRCVKLNTTLALGENLLRFPMLSGEDILRLN